MIYNTENHEPTPDPRIQKAADELRKLGNPGFLLEALQAWIRTPGNLAQNHWHVNSEIQEQQIQKALAILDGES